VSNIVQFPIKQAFAFGQAAYKNRASLADNPYTPGTFEYTQWVIGYQWGTQAANRYESGVAQRSSIGRTRRFSVS
jgi:hypothetical protein